MDIISCTSTIPASTFTTTTPSSLQSEVSVFVDLKNIPAIEPKSNPEQLCRQGCDFVRHFKSVIQYVVEPTEKEIEQIKKRIDASQDKEIGLLTIDRVFRTAAEVDRILKRITDALEKSGAPNAEALISEYTRMIDSIVNQRYSSIALDLKCADGFLCKK